MPLSNLFWKGSELNLDDDPESLLLLAMALFCIAIPFQGLYILLSRMIREYSNPVLVPASILMLASRCELVSYACGEITAITAVQTNRTHLHRIISHSHCVEDWLLVEGIE